MEKNYRLENIFEWIDKRISLKKPEEEISPELRDMRGWLSRQKKRLERKKLTKKEMKAIYYSENKERIKKRNKEWQVKNKDRFIKWKELNKEKIKEGKKKYYSSEHGKLQHIKHSQKRRKYAKDTNDNTITTKFLLELVKTTRYCIFTGIELNESNRHLDHIIPLSRGGKHTANNVRFISASANLKKNRKLDSEFILTLYKLPKIV